jgi:hypothetical protein
MVDSIGNENRGAAVGRAAERQLIAAYLNSARDDVATLSPTGLRLLEMTIASLTEGLTVNVAGETPGSLS